MPDTPDRQRQQRRSPEDIERDKRVYQYLLQLCGIHIQDKPETKDIVNMWGCKGNRGNEKFVDRVLSNLYDPNSSNTLPTLSLNRLVKILKGIAEYWKNHESTASMPKFLETADKIRAIRKYCELSKQEKYDLGLPVDFQTYIQENLIKLSNLSLDKLNRDSLPQKYEKNKDGKILTLKDDYLKQVIEQVLQSKAPEYWGNNQEKLRNFIEKIFKKLKNEVNFIALQSGLQIAQYIASPRIIPEQCFEKFYQTYESQWEAQFSDEIIRQLVYNIVDNIRLTESFPIELKYIEIDRVGPLPLDDKKNSLINKDLLKRDPDRIAVKEIYSVLRNKHTYRVKLHFRLRFKESEVLDFVEEVRGTSSILSLIRKALNRALFWDLPCLKEYFPVLQEVYLGDKVYEGDSLATIWSQSRVRLVNLEDLKETLQKDKSEGIDSNSLIDFNSYLEGSDIFQGDYIGFDLIESIANSGFYARLKVVEQSNIKADKYIEELITRVKEKKALLQGKKYLFSYPFSLLAMETYLNKEIIEKNQRKPQEWSKIAYEAYFRIIQGYLAEGLTIKVEEMLKKIENHVQYFSHFLKTNYYLCKAEYTFLLAENQNKRLRVSECQEYLEKAENELKQRLLMFFRIGEMSQGNLSPLFDYWARIYALKGRLYIFFPTYPNESISELFEPLIFLGKARFYAARDGNSYLYATVALYQSWCYLMQAYIGNEPEGFNKRECIEWAKKLIDNALFCYSDISNETYLDYIRNVFTVHESQDLDNYQDFGDIKIERPPILRLIHKLQEKNVAQIDRAKKTRENNTVEIDSALIMREWVSDFYASSLQPTNLFGQHSSLYFFAYAMLKLCDSDTPTTDDIKDAYKYFICCWAIAQGGAKFDDPEDRTKLDRDSNFVSLTEHDIKIEDELRVSQLKSIYFHRLPELVDLAKIFAAVCKCIIGDRNSLAQVKTILGKEENILSKVPDDEGFKTYAAGQIIYNGHLKKQFELIKNYLENYPENLLEKHQNKEISKRRDEIVKKVFRNLRGG